MYSVRDTIQGRIEAGVEPEDWGWVWDIVMEILFPGIHETSYLWILRQGVLTEVW